MEDGYFVDFGKVKNGWVLMKKLYSLKLKKNFFKRYQEDFSVSYVAHSDFKMSL